jgi:hypothetical protein
LPTYLQTGEYVPIPLEGEAGAQATARIRLPWFDVGAINPLEIPRTLAERINPLIRVPYALTMGVDPATGQSLEGMRSADFLGRMLPAQLGGAVETEKGLQQSARSKLITGSIPVPAGAILRSLFPDADQEQLASRGTELALRSFGLTPRLLTPDVYAQAQEEMKRRIKEEIAAEKQASYYER